MRDFKDIKVAGAGTGYVGLSIATLLSQHHHVTAVDVITLMPLWLLSQPFLSATLATSI